MFFSSKVATFTVGFLPEFFLCMWSVPSETRRNGFLLGKMKDAEMRGEAAKDTPDVDVNSGNMQM